MCETIYFDSLRKTCAGILAVGKRKNQKNKNCQVKGVHK